MEEEAWKNHYHKKSLLKVPFPLDISQYLKKKEQRVKIIKKVEDVGIHVLQMQDGDIAEILSWSNTTIQNGVIVQRFNNALVALGKNSGDCWSGLFTNKGNMVSSNCRVRILPKGTQLKV